MLPKEITLPDNQKFGTLLTPDMKLHRKYFEEMTKLYGINVVYYAPRKDKEYTLHGELFSNVTKLKIGDKIYLKTNGQDEIEYTIYKIFETSSSDASFYNRDTQGKREITLSTCTDDVEVTDNRLIILGKEE